MSTKVVTVKVTRALTIEKQFPGMLPKALWMLAKVCHCSRELLWRKCSVNRYKVTHFSIINKFWELLVTHGFLRMFEKCILIYHTYPLGLINIDQPHVESACECD
jgi:hypothetical protein